MSPDANGNGKGTWRGVLMGAGCALLASAVIGGIWLSGFGTQRRARIVSGSMAPALIGPHWPIECGDCGYGYRCSYEQTPAPAQVVCPMCGARQEPPVGDPLAGEPVEIDSQSIEESSPARWDVVAFAKSNQTDHWETKRVAGLPGEEITIRNGDIWVAGKIARKSLEQFRRMAVPVHDSRFLSQKTADLGDRWEIEAESGWVQRDGRFVFSTRGSLSKSQWVNYQHWLGMASSMPRNSTSPILDNYAENQDVSRKLHIVNDLLLSCEAMFGPNAILTMQLITRGVHVRGIWDLQKRSVALQVGEKVIAQKTLNHYSADVHKMELAVLDGHAIWRIQGPEGDELTALECRLPDNRELTPAASPAGLTVARDAAQFDYIKLSRDLHYLEPNLSEKPWSLTLGDDEYLVLGDNAPVSKDSRQLGAIKRSEILGLVKQRP